MSRQATQSTQPAPSGPGAAQADSGVARSPFLDASLDKAHRLAISQHHGGVSSEHLLFALSEDPEALAVLGISTVNIERLRADITTHLGQFPNDTPTGKAILPTPDLLKVLKLAAMAAQQSARRQIDGAIVLAAMIGDASTPSAGLLRAHGLTFNEVIKVLQKSIGAPPPNQPMPAAAPMGTASVAPQPVATMPLAPATAAAPMSQPAADDGKATSGKAERQPARPSTDELLASVRARLQEAAPPPVRNVEKPTKPDAEAPAAAPDMNVPVLPPQNAAAAQARETGEQKAPAPSSERSHSIAEPMAADAAVTAEKPLARGPVAMPVPAPQSERANGPRTPADLLVPAATKGPISQVEAGSRKPNAAPSVTAGAAAAWAAAEAALALESKAAQPPLPLVPTASPRTGPPPLPLPSMAAAMATPVAAPLPASQPPSPMPSPIPSPPANLSGSTSAGVSAQPMARETMRVPPIPPPSVDMRSLVATLPRRLRQGQTDIIEVIVPRRALEIPPAPGHRWPPLRVATMRLKAGADDAHVELASPETLWISPPRVHQGADDATWRWRITPRNKGRIRLSLAGATRIVGSEGISGEVPLGEESIEIDVARRGSRRGLVGLLLFGNLTAIGFLAMLMSGRAAEIILGALSALRRLAGLD